VSETKCRVAVLASGTGSNFRAITEACRSPEYPARVVCLVTDNPQAGALEIARAQGVSAHTVEVRETRGRLPYEAESEMARICASNHADLIALAGFMRILKGPLLERFENRIMNIHPALLPSFPGLHSARQALDYGVKITGCTVHFVNRSIDAGPIILQSVVTVLDDDDEESLLARMHVEEHKSYVEAVRLFAEGRLMVQGRRVKVLQHPAREAR